jgi:hypothetical protein
VNRQDLKKLLDSRGVDPRRYNLDGGLDNDTLCIKRQGNRWCVYYTERGEQFDRRCYPTEDEACQDLLARMFA